MVKGFVITCVVSQTNASHKGFSCAFKGLQAKKTIAEKYKTLLILF
jgi:hypothetical protein